MSSEQRRLAGRYVLESPIGRGGMGQVWRATDTVLGREVAVKTIDLRSVPDESGAARFEREARVTAGLSHPGVVTVHDSGVEGDTAYLVMELLPGPSLAERMAAGPLPVDEVVEVGRQVASALDAAHARGLVHRDIKPANVAYAADGRVRVLDFGITQLGEAAGSQALTATHTVMGTAEYLAPEQALGGRVDGRADLYALGCLLYALLAGRPPFRAATPVATMMMHANDPVPDVRDLRPDTPDWLADLVHGLLAKDPEDRPAGAAARRGGPRGAGGPRRAPPRPCCRPPGPRRRSGSTRVPTAGARAPPGAASPRRRPARGRQRPRLGAGSRGRRGPRAARVDRVRRRRGPDRDPDVHPVGLDARADQRGAPDDGGPPTPTPTPTPTTESPTPSPDPADAVASSLSAFSDEVAAVERDGLVDKDAAKKLDDVVRDIERALRDDDPEKVVGGDRQARRGVRQGRAGGRDPGRRGGPPRPAPPGPHRRRRRVRGLTCATGPATSPSRPRPSRSRGRWRSCSPLVASRPLVRALGTGHSFSRVADTTGTHVSTRSLPLEVEVLPEQRVAIVPGGATYAVVTAALHARGWALHNLGSLPHISVAGACSTGTHGSGDANGSLSTAVVAVELVRGDGELVRFAHGDPEFPGRGARPGLPGRRDPALAAGRAGLGGAPGRAHRRAHGGAARRHPRRHGRRAQRQPVHVVPRPVDGRRGLGQAPGGGGRRARPRAPRGRAVDHAAAPRARHGPGRHDDPARHGRPVAPPAARTSGPSSRRARGRSCSRSSSCPAPTRRRRSRR